MSQRRDISSSNANNEQLISSLLSPSYTSSYQVPLVGPKCLQRSSRRQSRVEGRMYQRLPSTERSEVYSTSRTDFEAIFETMLTIATDRQRQFHEGYVTGTQSDVKKVRSDVRSLQSISLTGSPSLRTPPNRRPTQTTRITRISNSIRLSRKLGWGVSFSRQV